MNRVVPVAVVIALLLPAAALADARFRCLYTGQTSDHCDAVEARAEPASDGPALERVCCQALESSFVAAPARVETASQLLAAAAALPAAPATRARPREGVRVPDLLAREGPTRGLTPPFLLHCSLLL